MSNVHDAPVPLTPVPSKAPEVVPVTGHAHHCGNCAAPLSGPYCAQCGQHAHESARNLSAVIHNAWHDLTHVDGRLWSTLYLLLLRPGRLTIDYFEERRARYLPPVRLYLVLSLLFFSLSHVDKSSTVEQAPGAGTSAQMASANAPAKPDAADADADADAGKHKGFRVAIDNDEFDLGSTCEHIEMGGIASLTRGARQACERIRTQKPEEFIRALLHNVPKMMFVFMPLMAGIMSALYWRPRRYYVEHLVFLLHNHSAVYLGFLLVALLGFIPLGATFGSLVALFAVAVTFYLPVYLYLAQRRYYRQGRWLTLAKYGVLVLAYFVCLVITLLGTAAITAYEG